MLSKQYNGMYLKNTMTCYLNNTMTFYLSHAGHEEGKAEKEEPKTQWLPETGCGRSEVSQVCTLIILGNYHSVVFYRHKSY